MFLKDLQTKLIPIYHLTKKGVPFHWGELQQKAFEMIKKDLTEALVLAMPNNKGHMVLVSDTSKIACGSALYQEQKGRVSISSCTHLWCFSARVYGLELIGGLSPISMSIVTKLCLTNVLIPFRVNLRVFLTECIKSGPHAWCDVCVL